jgi:chitodextrinase
VAISFVGITTAATTAGGTSTSISPSIPSGVLAGDLLILNVNDGADPGTITGPSGWTLLRRTIDTGTAPAESAVNIYWKAATGSDSAPTFSCTTASRFVATLAAYRGVDTTTPFVTENAVAEAGGASTTVHTAPTLTNTNSSAWGVYALTGRTQPTPYNATPGTGLTERADAEVGNTGSTNVLGYWADSNGTVATGSVTYSATANGGSAIAVMWAGLLKPSTADTAAPTVPTAVTATANSPTQVTISWTASTDNVAVASYRVRRDGTNVTGATAVTGTSFVDTSVAGSTTYSYTVSAVDAAGNRSAESTASTVTTPDPDVTAPTTPTGVTAVVNSPTSITVSWTASTDDVSVASYRVRRGGTTVTGGSAVTGTSFTDNTVSANTSYSYTVSAVDPSGNRSAESSAASATTPAGTPITKVGSNGGFSADGGTTVTQVNPAGVAVGDMLVVSIHNNDTTASIATPTGWDLTIGPINDAQTGDGHHYVFTRYADGTAADTPTWTNSAAGVLAYVVVALRGVTAIHKTGFLAGTGTPTGGITMATGLDGCYLVNFIGDRKGSAGSSDATPRFTQVDTTNWTSEFDTGVSPGPTSSLSVHASVRSQLTAGTVPVQTYTQVSTTNGYVITQLALSSASAPPVPGTYVFAITGVPDGDSVPVKVKTSGAANVRLKVATNAGLTTGVTFTAGKGPDASGYTSHVITGLTANTSYWYGVEVDGIVGSSVGSFRTDGPGTAQSFRVAFGPASPRATPPRRPSPTRWRTARTCSCTSGTGTTTTASRPARRSTRRASRTRSGSTPGWPSSSGRSPPPTPGPTTTPAAATGAAGRGPGRRAMSRPTPRSSPSRGRCPLVASTAPSVGGG